MPSTGTGDGAEDHDVRTFAITLPSQTHFHSQCGTCRRDPGQRFPGPAHAGKSPEAVETTSRTSRKCGDRAERASGVALAPMSRHGPPKWRGDALHPQSLLFARQRRHSLRFVARLASLKLDSGAEGARASERASAGRRLLLW